jgi:hypothetical protein
MNFELISPLSPDDFSQWESACKMAETSRGMALEILGQSEPLGWGPDGVFWAACANEKLASGWANEFAAHLLQFAFQNPSMSLALCHLNRELNAHLVWALRQQAKSKLLQQEQFDAYQSEKPCEDWVKHFNAQIIDSTFKPF